MINNITETPVIIYRSSAGSGKTYNLVKEYLKIILNDPESYKNILAITFTNKAAAEMKSRIVSALVELSKGNNESLAKQLTDEGVYGDIKGMSAYILKKILHNYTYFNIQTIDSFFYMIIRSFSREIGLYLGTKVQLKSDKVLGEAVDDLIRSAGDNEDLTTFLEDYIRYNIDEDKTWNIDNSLKSLGNEIFKERFQEKMLDSNTDLASSITKIKLLEKKLYEIRDKYENSLKDCGNKAKQIFDDNNLNYSDFHQGKGGFINWLVNKLRNEDYEYTKRVTEIYEDPERIISKTKNKQAEKVLRNELMPLLNKAYKIIESKTKEYNTACSVISTLHTIGIFKEIISKINEYTDTNQELLISQFSPLLRSFVIDEASPFIFEKIGNTFKYFLIDEAQDTSTFQWDNLKPLVENALSEGGKVVIAGDVKQSIYRWRNGNLNLLMTKIKDDLKNFTMQNINLKDNWRSRKKIVLFMNSFISSASDMIEEKVNDIYNYNPGKGENIINNIYKDFSQDHVEDKEGGYVNISFIDDHNILNNEFSGQTCEKVIGIINDLKKLGYKEEDITILSREKKHCFSIAESLLKEGIKVISEESLLIANSPKIRLLINLLSSLVNNKNEINRIETVINKLSITEDTDVDLEKLFRSKNGAFSDILNNKFPVKLFSDAVNFKLSNKLSAMTLYEIVENLVRVLDLLKTDKGQIDAYVIKFLDSVLEFTNETSADIPGFLDWWEENKNELCISLPASVPAVKVMTIHKAKGLQNKIVILPFADWEMDHSGGRDHIWVSSEKPPFDSHSAYLVAANNKLQNTYFSDDYNAEGILTNIDNLNLLYVAMTRAKEHLYVISSYNSAEKSDQKINTVAKLLLKVLKEKFDHEPSEPFETGIKKYYEKSSAAKDKKEEIENIKLQYKSTVNQFLGLGNIIVLPKYRSLKIMKDKTFEDKTNLGTLIHEILHRMRAINDLDKVINDLENDGLINIDNKDTVLKAVNKVLSNKKVRSWFSDEWEVRSENDILMPDGKIIRPDRVLIKDNKALVIDWKTGIHKDEHVTQVIKYANALKENGYDQVDMCIYNFIEDNVLEFTN